MKKIIILIMIVTMMLTFVSCGDQVTTKEDLSDYLQVDVSVTSEKIGNETFYFDYLDSETVAITNYEGPDTPHKVIIPSKLNNKVVAEIAKEAFKYKSSITEVEIPNTIVKINDYAFRDCATLTTLTLPATVKNIGIGAFYGCVGMKTVSIAENGITVIPDYAFMKCSSLEEVLIPSTITEMGKAAFFECKKLNKVNMLEGIKTIGEQAFQNCSELADIYFAATLEEIGELAFAGSEKLYVEGIHFAATATEDNMNMVKEAIGFATLTNKPVEG